MARLPAILALAALGLQGSQALRANTEASADDEAAEGHFPNPFRKKPKMDPITAALHRDPAVKAALKKPPVTNETMCKCMNWRATYLLGRSRCGNGAELFTYTGGVNTKDAVPNFMRREDTMFCNDPPHKKDVAFFPKQNHHLCVRMNRFDPVQVHDGGSWCYVSPYCNIKGSFKIDNATVRAKICWPGIDTMLADIQPSALWEMAREMLVDYKMMAQMSYKPAGLKWDKHDRLGARMNEASWKGNQWFDDDAGAIKVAWWDQLWHVYEDNGKPPICIEGCDKLEFLFRKA